MKNNNIYILVILVLGLVLYYFITNKEGVYFSTGVYYNGHNMAYYPEYTINQCQQACNIRQDCKGFTTSVVDTGTTEGKGHCWLKRHIFGNPVKSNDLFTLQKY
jgi:hypothetical protein